VLLSLRAGTNGVVAGRMEIPVRAIEPNPIAAPVARVGQVDAADVTRSSRLRGAASVPLREGRRACHMWAFRLRNHMHAAEVNAVPMGVSLWIRAARDPSAFRVARCVTRVGYCTRPLQLWLSHEVQLRAASSPGRARRALVRRS